MRSNSLKFRLTALFSGIIIVTTLFLFGFSYFLLSSSLMREEARERQSRLIELWAMYQIDGPDLLQDVSIMQNFLIRNRSFLIRISGPQNATLFYYVPDLWGEIPMEQLEEQDIPESTDIQIMETALHRLEIDHLRLGEDITLQIGSSVNSRLLLLKRYRNTFVIVAIPLIVLGFTGGVIVSGRSLKPIQDLNRAVQSIITTGKLKERIPSRGGADELDSLVVQFNHMLERIESLVQGMRDALDNVAHDIRTPMARFRAKAELALESTDNPEELQRALREQIEESQRVLGLLSTLMDISEVETGTINLRIDQANLSAVLEDMIDLYRYGAEEKDIVLNSEIQQDLYANIDVDRIRQVMANLLDNAVKYSPRGGSIEVTAARTTKESNDTDFIKIRVRDAGTGIRDSEKDKIWDRLYRSDASRSEPGLGLGLSLVKAIVETHGGNINLESQPGQGSSFEVSLPGSNMTKM